MANGQKLTEEVQRFIVLSLACYETPTEVARAVKERFGIEIDRQLAAHYSGPEAAKEWQDLYAATRKHYLEDTASVAIAQQGFRLRELEKIHGRAKTRGADKMAADILKQAAEEVGGVYTNVRALNGKFDANLTVRQIPAGVDAAREILRAAGLDS